MKQKTHKLLSPFRSHSKARATSAQPTPRINVDAPSAEGAGHTGGAATLPRESSPAARPSGIDTPPVGGSGPTGAGGTATPLRGRSPSPRFSADTSPRGGVAPTDDVDVIEDPEASGGSVSLQDVAKIVKDVAGTVSEFSDAFPPLKTVAIGLKLIFERVEVCLP